MSDTRENQGELRGAAPPIADSPWFWLALFAAGAVVAIGVIQPKYAQRQWRIEQRWDHRVQARAHRAAQATDDEQALPVEPVELEATQAAEPWPRARLEPLVAILLIVVCLATGMLVRERRRGLRASAPRIAQPPASAPEQSP